MNKTLKEKIRADSDAYNLARKVAFNAPNFKALSMEEVNSLRAKQRAEITANVVTMVNSLFD